MRRAGRPHAPDARRVARVLVRLPDGENGEERYDFASGYLIADRLILTAAHVLEAGSPAIIADLGADGDWRPVTERWSDTRIDLALLELDRPPAHPVPPVHIGSVLRRAGAPVTALALGHPRHTTFPGDLRGRVEARCVIHPGDTGDPGTLRATLDRSPEPAAPGESPWKGMSGAALVTERSGLLVAVFRGHLTAAGTGTQEITMLDEVEDEDWRAALRDHGIDPRPRPAFPDDWNVAGRELRPHHDHMASIPPALCRIDDHLPFVDPGDGPASPRGLLERLAAVARDPALPAGVVITGAAGAGKTRLCLETAALADREGWLVLHLTASLPLDSVWESVRDLADRVLLVAEDADLVAEPPEDLERLCQRAAGDGVACAILTTARDNRVSDVRKLPTHANTDLGTVFEPVAARADAAYRMAISRAMVRKLAPEAVKQQDEQFVVGMCEGPPAVSQLLARYYNGEAAAHRVLTRAPRPRDGALGTWPPNLLKDAGLVAVAALRPPDPVTAAVARIVAVAPCPVPAALNRVAEAYAGSDDDPGAAGGIVLQRLSELGLLYAVDDMLQPGHDLYADHMLAQCVLAAGSRDVHPRGLDAVLDAGLAGRDALTRVAVAVNRLAEALADDGDRLNRKVDAWAARNLDGLTGLIVGDVDGAVLRALLPLGSWRPVLRDSLAAAWLERHGGRRVARDTVVAVATRLPDVGQPYLVAWLDRYPVERTAARAYGRAALPHDAPPDDQTTENALTWLTHYGTEPVASHVLQRLLQAGKGIGLPHGDPRVPGVVAKAVHWLTLHGDKRSALFVAGPLVERPEFRGPRLLHTAKFLLGAVAEEDRDDARTATVPLPSQERRTDTRKHPDDASFAFVSLLSRQRLYGDLAEHHKDAVQAALRWVEEAQQRERPVTAHVLKELISPNLPSRDALPRAVQAAWNWVRAMRATERTRNCLELGLVLPALLRNARKSTGRNNAAFTPEEQAELATYAVAWLAAGDPRHRRRGEIDVLGTLLYTRLIDDDHDVLHRHADRALTLVENTPSATLARSLLPPLLHKRNLDAGTRDRLLTATFTALDERPTDEHTAYPLTSLLQRVDLTAAERERAMAAALRWLDAHPLTSAAFRLLTSAFTAAGTTAEDRGRIAARAAHTLSPRYLAPRSGGPFLTDILLDRRAEIPAEWNRYVARACDLLHETDLPVTAFTALLTMLKGTDRLDPLARDRLHATCADWCERHPRSNRTPALLTRLLGDRALAAGTRRRATVAGRRKLRPGSERVQHHGPLLVALLRDGDLVAGEEVEHVLNASLDWLAVRSQKDPAILPLLQQVAHRLGQQAHGEPRTRAARRALDIMDERLRRHLLGGGAEPDAVEALRERLTALSDEDGPGARH
ncbi:serine protease [Streptomyces sp. RFCAC02]|uniref:S1 family peptidase n=1 Tax=Streptomyces sp. RFCAC02 TaxID=2499143 RepID=UPI0010228241|nr:serine protease [Streptomyces sp. RFCAC02]